VVSQLVAWGTVGSCYKVEEISVFNWNKDVVPCGALIKPSKGLN